MKSTPMIAALALTALAFSEQAPSSNTSPTRISQAQDWAVRIASSVADPWWRVPSSSKEQLERRIKLLVPNGSITPVRSTYDNGEGSDAQEGVVKLEYQIAGPDANGKYSAEWVHILMPRKDSNGADVFKCVEAELRQRMPKTFVFRGKPPGEETLTNDFYTNWFQKRTHLRVNLLLRSGDPADKLIPRPWVYISIGEETGDSEEP